MEIFRRMPGTPRLATNLEALTGTALLVVALALLLGSHPKPANPL